MATENEKLLVAAIQDIQNHLQDLANYNQMLHDTIWQLAAPPTNSPITMPFCSQQSIYMSIPFNCMPESWNVDVYITDPGGYGHRKANPLIQFSGGAITVTFDSPKDGYIIATPTVLSGGPANLPCAPTSYFPQPVALLDDFEEKQEEPQEESKIVEVEKPLQDRYERAMGILK